ALVTRRLWLVALTFGLAHGFGFASVLADLGLPRDTLLISLVAFNLGVELGQLAIVAAALPLIYALCRWRHYPLAVLQGGSFAIVSVASLWFN
ncbi:HupE/UreJ family protein, partial [Klebsiella pneumoniae]|uniref:HupE/UreJ family protein n=1 Tax=Klebsiella pneumoniae TaxID=573 RepID=UPI0025A0ACA4